MIHQRSKDLLFSAARPALGALSWFHRFSFQKGTRKRPLWFNLGCGDKYLPSFLNGDINPFRKIDLWLDIRNRLPFPDRSVEGIYAQEVLEHLYPNELEPLLKECLRVLKSGSFLRITVPDLRRAVEAYRSGQLSKFPDWPRRHGSAGGRLSNLLFCDGQHRNAFDFSFLKELLEGAGFGQVQEFHPGESQWMDPASLSVAEGNAGDSRTPLLLYVEARRP